MAPGLSKVETFLPSSARGGFPQCLPRRAFEKRAPFFARALGGRQGGLSPAQSSREKVFFSEAPARETPGEPTPRGRGQKCLHFAKTRCHLFFSVIFMNF